MDSPAKRKKKKSRSRQQLLCPGKFHHPVERLSEVPPWCARDDLCLECSCACRVASLSMALCHMVPLPVLTQLTTGLRPWFQKKCQHWKPSWVLYLCPLDSGQLIFPLTQCFKSPGFSLRLDWVYLLAIYASFPGKLVFAVGVSVYKLVPGQLDTSKSHLRRENNAPIILAFGQDYGRFLWLMLDVGSPAHCGLSL